MSLHLFAQRVGLRGVSRRVLLCCEQFRHFGSEGKSEGKNDKPRIVFVCVANSCRSQMADVLGTKHLSDYFDVHSAGMCWYVLVCTGMYWYVLPLITTVTIQPNKINCDSL